MSNDWPRGWYSDEPDRPGAGGQRPQPSFTPSSPGPRGQRPPDSAERGWYAPGNAADGSRDAGGPGAGNAWPAQPPSRSWTGGGAGPAAVSAAGGTGRAEGGGGCGPRRILVILAGLVVLVVVATVAVYFSVNSKLTKVDVLMPTALTSAGTNWLITGSDSRAGLTKQEENQLALGHDITGSRSDTIMLLHVPANGTRPTLVSLPRDSYVPIPGHGYNKLNAAYAFGGPEAADRRPCRTSPGCPSATSWASASAGWSAWSTTSAACSMCLKAPMKDPKAGLNLKAGCQTLNGDQALGFVRTRAFAVGDLQREQDQRVLIKGILSKMTSAGHAGQPVRDHPRGQRRRVRDHDRPGHRPDPADLRGVRAAEPGDHDGADREPGFANTNVGSVVEWNHTAARQFFNDLAHDQALPKNLITGSSVEGTA